MDNRTTILDRFINEWPESRIKRIQLEDYAQGAINYKDTFSYWIETVTESLGDIGGMGGGGSFKHGIYFKAEKKKYNAGRESDGTFAWETKYGTTPLEAFEKIKAHLINVISFAQSGDWNAIDNIDFYAPVKWKWTFLYSNAVLIPVYKKEALKIATRVFNPDFKGDSYPEYYSYYNSIKNQDESTFAIGDRVWTAYLNNRHINYYILGSKYGKNANVDVFPEMYENNVISTGFAFFELSDLVGKPHNEIITFLKNRKEESKSYSCLKYFLNIKPGDKVAIKADGSPKGTDGFLSIVGIAEVLDRDEYYQFDADSLGHTLPVKWLKAPVYKEFGYGGYGRTIHKIEDNQMINSIFNSNYDIIPLVSTNNLKNSESSINMKNINQILFGPPGTGKTYKLQQIIDEWDLKAKTGTEKNYTLFAKNYTWWKIIALALLDLQKVTVPELAKHPLIKAKLGSSNVKQLNTRLWSSLQHHCVDNCENVKLVKRIGERVFYKEANSEWRLDNPVAFRHEFIALVDAYKDFNTSDDSKTKDYTFTTCHQSLTYEDFIEGIKPDLNLLTEEDEEEGKSRSLVYEIRKGIFYTACEKAVQKAGFINLKDCLDTPKDQRKIRFEKAISENKIHVIFLDEINRCNVSAVFGELITLIEEDKRLGKENEITDITLPYSQEEFGVPANLYIIGTMNTADRSVEALDTALRRRFSFEEMPPLYGLEGTKYLISEYQAAAVLQTINLRIEKLIDKDHAIGHSYFLNKDAVSAMVSFYKNIIPLLQEYFFGDYGKVGLVLGAGFVRLKTYQSDSTVFADFDLDVATSFEDRDVYEIVDYRKTKDYKLTINKTILDMDFDKAIQVLMNKRFE